MYELLKVSMFIFIVTSCASGPKVYDLSSEFIKFHDKSNDLPTEKQKELFDLEVGSKFPAFYDYKSKSWAKQEKRKLEHFSKEMKLFPKIKLKYIQASKSFRESLATNIKSFKKTFPDFNESIEIYLIHSFGEMDGGTRNFDGKLYLIFGADGMARYHDFANKSPFFHHELFHVYHNQFFQESRCDVIWCALWAEGLAVLVAKKLNAAATYAELLLDIPKGLVKNVEMNLQRSFKLLLSKLDSKDRSDYRTFFLMNSSSKEIAPRGGYYLGYLVAKELEKKFSIQALAKLSPEQLEPLVKSTVSQLSKISH